MILMVSTIPDHMDLNLSLTTRCGIIQLNTPFILYITEQMIIM